MDIDKFDVILDASDDDFTNDLMRALGVTAGDNVTFLTPQFDRADGRVVAYLPNTEIEYEAIKELSSDSLKKIGCQVWSEEGGKRHWLYPCEWYDHIPDGTEIIDICGKVGLFKHDETDNDKRYGALAYGFIQTIN